MITIQEINTIKESSKNYQKENIPKILQEIAENISFLKSCQKKWEEVIRNSCFEEPLKSYIEFESKEGKSPMIFFLMASEKMKIKIKFLESSRDWMIKKINLLEL